ncbi:amino acid ABC transporter substrate-binding protein [Clostridium baratii]|uniref:amino acid ABC transporter substrate-binding protein n=1 Tax=Clostridium baratii TaxID=1561 RepID=UPI0006C1C075|nr:amino acid ABC transporter substrate-binding protein [Clostridium baratii]CUP21288.1 amino acid ABC transporter substrate-binding protein [Clostridium baratii]
MKKNLINLLVWIIIIFIGFIIVHFLNENNKQQNDEVITVGYDDTFVPMGFVNNDGQVVGFDIDLAKAISKKINKKIVFRAIDWTMKETELRNKNIDLIWNGYSITKEREKQIDFSNPYISDRQVIIVRSNSKINCKDDFKGKKIGVQSASSASDALMKDKKFVDSLSNNGVIEYQSNNDALMDLDSGRINGVVADEVLARYYMNKRGNDKYRVLKDDFGREYFGIGIRKGDAKLKNEINKGLKEVIDDGEAKKISEKWFGEDIVIKGEE